jgi:hypothetical protein
VLAECQSPPHQGMSSRFMHDPDRDTSDGRKGFRDAA